MTSMKIVKYKYVFLIANKVCTLTSKIEFKDVSEIQEYYRNKIKDCKFGYYMSVKHKSLKPNVIHFYQETKWLLEVPNIFDIGIDRLNPYEVALMIPWSKENSSLTPLEIFDLYNDCWK